MTTDRLRRIGAFAAALSVLTAAIATADTVVLSRPVEAVCVTGPAAKFIVDKGALRPERGVFAISPPGREPLEPQVSMPTDAGPGGLARAYVRSTERLQTVTASLAAAGARSVASAVGFRVETSELSETWAVLVGVPDWCVPGEYTLTLTVTAGERRFLDLGAVTVHGRDFRSESFAITGSMSNLLSTPDPKKEAQSRSFAKLVTTPDPAAVFEAGSFSVPFPEARRTSGYGDRRRYVGPDGTSPVSDHVGVDLAMPEGTLIPACGDGKVVFADFRILTGNTVVIEHLPGLFSIYFHMSAIYTKVGAVVHRGAFIGAVGMTGFATGPHLHWEVTAGGVPIDPDLLVTAPLLDKSPVFVDTFPRTSTEGR